MLPLYVTFRHNYVDINNYLLLLTLSLWLSSISLRVKCDSVCKTPNTGTALFRTIDVHRRHCWSREELALLYTRRALVDLVPKQIPHNVPLILELTQICLTTLREMTSTSPRVYDYMSAALADTLGGYLQSYGLPLLHEAYYEGYVSYDNAAELHRIQEHFKALLTTDGGGWTRPMVVRKQLNRVLPLKVSTAENVKPCTLLLTNSQSTPGEELNSSQNYSSSLIPLPVLDGSNHPDFIAVPMKNRAVYNLKDIQSYDILLKYYVEATKCISDGSKATVEQTVFDAAFANWIKHKVLPRLKDQVWYVGFSNVLRIYETIQQKIEMISPEQPFDPKFDTMQHRFESTPYMTKSTWFFILGFAILSLIALCFLYWTFVKACVMCCKRDHDESSRGWSEVESTDTTSLLSTDDSGSNYFRTKSQRKKCKHRDRPMSVTSQNMQHSDSPRNLTEGSGASNVKTPQSRLSSASNISSIQPEKKQKGNNRRKK